MDTVLQDVRFAVRTLIRRPAFALVAIVTLALGIGGNTAVFSVVNAVLLRSLPIPTADRLVFVWGREFNGIPAAAVSPADYLDFVANTRAFEELAAIAVFSNQSVYRGGDRPVPIVSQAVTHNLLQALGVQPALGRGFTKAETRGEVAEVVMLTYGLWGRLFGFDESVLGTNIALGARQYTIIGILPDGLDFPAGADAWLPLTFGAYGFDNRSAHFLRPIGLLPEGGSIADAQVALDAVASRLEAEYPETNTDWYPIVQDLRSVVIGSVRPALLVLLAAIGLVLLIACANVANLLLARAASRRGEVAIRFAVGAGRGRVVRQLITESLILASCAGTLGVILAKLGVIGLARLQPGNIPRMDEVTLDGTVLLFTAVLSLTVGVVFGLLPALGLASDDVASGLRSAGRGRLGGGERLRSVLVGGEVALSFVLLVGAGLLTRSFLELRAVDPGFDAEGVLVLPLSFESGDDPAALTVQLDAVLDALRGKPGVRSVGAATVLPFSGLGGDTYVYAEERPPEQVRNIENTALIRMVDEGYFQTLASPPSSGRSFDRADDASASGRVIINQALADRLFPDETPVGRRLVVVFDTATALEIIGVVDDVQQFSLATPAMPEFFLSLRQYPQAGMSVIVRGRPGSSPVASLREAVWDVDPTQLLTRVSSLDTMIATTLAPGRFQAVVLGLFSALAVLLAGIGIYGVLAEGVNERRREIGVRMAMGAQPSEVVRDVVRRGLVVAVAGIGVGAVVAVGATRLLSSLLFAVEPGDPLTFVLTPVFLLGVVLLSSWIPAAQAARVDPVQALREER